MKQQIYYIDRQSHKKSSEMVYGSSFLHFLYGESVISRFLGMPIATLISKNPFFSKLYGYFQSKPSSKKKIIPFINTFEVDTTEFAESVDHYSSFNDFFTRHLKASARPIASQENVAMIPADGRYFFYQTIDQADGFVVKGKKFCLKTLLGSETLAEKYAQGSMVIARLCPTDYHRYHFPCSCVPTDTQLINGWLYSVNPLAIKKNVHIFTENKRTLCTLKSEMFGEVLFLEVGATFVGAIHQTYQPDQYHEKGQEKGYFSFGASSLILLFPPKTIQFDQDLLDATANEIEIKCLMGQSMGRKVGV